MAMLVLGAKVRLGYVRVREVMGNVQKNVSGDVNFDTPDREEQ